MKKILTEILILLAASMALSACGGGGGGEAAPAQPTRAIVKLFTQGTTTFTISALQATLHLPAGVSVKVSTTDPPWTDDGVVTASGTATGAEISKGIYSAGTVTVFVTKATVTTGFITVGEFATVNCDIAAGTKPTAADFSVTNLEVIDYDSAVPIMGLTPAFTADIQ